MNTLAPYAAIPDQSVGRQYQEAETEFRSPFQRDRDRIVHSTAFRRLQYKTQVFINHEGDMYRSRLTHSIEVAQIARSAARVLQLNEDLTEAICLAHDLGHTPFGHAGQDALNTCMKPHGGFEHNLQSLRIVDVLEQRYMEFPGLNLTFESREGIMKHCSREKAVTLGEIGHRFINKRQPGLEAQLANLADEIAYNNHDVDDGLRAGILTLEELLECEIISEHYKVLMQDASDIPEKQMRAELVRRMINTLVTDLIETTRKNIKQAEVKSIDEVRLCSGPLVSLSEQMKKKHRQLKSFLRKRLYNHHKVKIVSDHSRAVVMDLFAMYIASPEVLPEEYFHDKNSRPKENLPVHVKDYIAGMTDRFALGEHERLCGTDSNANRLISYG